MLSTIKEGDRVYIVFSAPNSPPRLEVVESVGRLFLRTRQGNKYCRTTGVQSRDTKRRDFAPTCKAWASKESYDFAVAHIIATRRAIRDLAELNAAYICVEDLTLIQDILKRAKKEKHNAPLSKRSA